MARMEQGILGGLSGKIGNVVGSSWKGIPVLKTKPLSVSNPKTTAQVAQRTKMTNATAFATEILASVIKPAWDRFAVKMSGYNDWIARNVDYFATTNPTPAANVIMSHGKMEAAEITGVIAVNNDPEVQADFGLNLGDPYANDSDYVYMVIHNRTTGYTKGGRTSRTRGGNFGILALNEAPLTGHVLDVWLFFMRTDGTVVSGSGYMQKTVTAS